LSGGRLAAGRVFHAIQARHWQQLASKHGGDTAWAAMIELVSGVDSALTRGSEYCPRTFRPPPEDHLHRHEAGCGPLREGSWTAPMRHLGSFGSPVVNVASGE
jgi:hypothetical protein